MSGGDATTSAADPDLDSPVSLEWARLVAAGPIRFDRFDGSNHFDHADHSNHAEHSEHAESAEAAA